MSSRTSHDQKRRLFFSILKIRPAQAEPLLWLILLRDISFNGKDNFEWEKVTYRAVVCCEGLPTRSSCWRRGDERKRAETRSPVRVQRRRWRSSPDLLCQRSDLMQSAAPTTHTPSSSSQQRVCWAAQLRGEASLCLQRAGRLTNEAGGGRGREPGGFWEEQERRDFI